MQGMSPQDRARYGRAAFGTQGAGAVAVLSDPQVQDQIRNLDKLRSSPEFLDSYRNFSGNYQAGSTMQDARTAVAQFNVTMGELARGTLPAVNNALGGFKGVLEGLRGVIPGGPAGGAVVGGHAIMGVAAGAAAGFGIGALGGPIGAAGGAVVGGMLGAAEGFMEGYARAAIEKQDKKTTEEFMQELKRQGEGGVVPMPKAAPTPISLSLNVDGTLLARVLSSISANSFEGQAPAFDGSSGYVGGDHQHTDK
jgi:hypothetical protein